MRFGAFELDPSDRRLSRGGKTVELSPRYMDALILLVKAAGELVPKDRFMEVVWRGVPVTDEALTQAIRTLRRTLGDSAGAPQFIETVPKHGYRFIAPVEMVEDGRIGSSAVAGTSHPRFIALTLAGTGGAVLAGALVGLLYGFVGAAQPPAATGGAVSLLLVLVLVSMFSAGVAGTGIAAGIAAAEFIRTPGRYWTVLGGAFGGVLVGAFANLLGKDAFRLLFGRAVGEFAGAPEGLILGGAIGLAACLSHQGTWRRCGVAGLLGLVAGLLVASLDGRMMAGSLQELVSAFPTSQFRLDRLSVALGEGEFGAIGRTVTAGFEGAVFSVAMIWALGGAARTPRQPPSLEGYSSSGRELPSPTVGPSHTSE